MAEPVRVGVVGVGAIGRHHTRVYAENAEVELVGIYDTDPVRALAVAERHGTKPFDAIERLLEQVDGVSIAVPTVVHAEVGVLCLSAGCDVLMEKPIAVTLHEAERLVATAQGAGRVLQVGHVERYNPAVEAVLPHVRRPAFIEIHRLGSFAERSLEVDVVVDLMIHDIDVVHALIGDDVVEVRAVGVPVLSAEIDIANARLQLAGGCTVNMTASRVSMSRVRKVRIFQPEAYFSVDYSSQEVACFRLEHSESERSSISGVPISVDRVEPLVREIDDFVHCIRTRALPRVTGQDGTRALATALQIRDAMRTAGEA